MVKKLLCGVGILGLVAAGLWAQSINTTFWGGLRWDTGPTAPSVCYEPGVFYQTGGTAQFYLCDVKNQAYVTVPKAVGGTLTSPNLGTPSAINLANATNLPSSAAPAVHSVDTNITAASLGTEAICALHTDTGCNNATTDATSANCPAGTLTATCTFPISLTIPANVLGSNVTTFVFSTGSLFTATIPTQLVEIYLDSVRIFAGVASTSTAGARAQNFYCSLAVATSTNSSPAAFGCTGNGNVGSLGGFSTNALVSNTTPAIAIDTTASHVLKVSISFSANTTGNMAWLYGMKLSY